METKIQVVRGDKIIVIDIKDLDKYYPRQKLILK